MGGWVSAPPPPWGGGGVGHLSVCGYAKILGGWVPELTPPPPPRVAKQNPGRRANTPLNATEPPANNKFEAFGGAMAQATWA